MSNTARFGPTNDLCRTPAEAAQSGVEDSDLKGNSDPDKLVQCPYDKNHMIRLCRVPYHLIKCSKNHPKLAKDLKTCPFNASHLVSKHELTLHIATCEYRIPVELEKDAATSGNSHLHVPVSFQVNTDMTEDWDAEADDYATPFVWGVNTNPSLNLNTMPTSNLGPSTRGPNSLPWGKYDS